MKNNKIISVWEIGRIISDMPTKPKVVFVPGVFDTPKSEYTTYVNFLEDLKDRNDLMIIGIFSDEFLGQKELPATEKIASIEKRIAFLSGFKSVDFIIIIDKHTDAHQVDVYKVIKDLRPAEFVTTKENTECLGENHETLTRFMSGYTKVVSIESRRKMVEVAV
jgi:bifunctional ADP-heptose synthase (sugar kinase/adenylyltransferase)